MENHQRVNQTSGNVERYTPFEIVELARRVMGGIDLDPASCVFANKPVKATVFYGQPEDGLNQEWAGRVWTNHPSKRGQNAFWVNKLIEEYEFGIVICACCITFAVMSEKWFRPLLQYPQCFPHGRVNYYGKDGKIIKGVTKGSVITYLGKDVDWFAGEFSKVGTIKVPYVKPRKRWWQL